MEKQIYLSEGTEIKSSNDIVKFINYMIEKYSVKLENGIIDAIVNAYTSNPKGKNHIVGYNKGDEWFMNFLSNEEVIGRAEIEKDNVVMDNKLFVKKSHNGGSNFTKPKKKRKK